MRRSALIIIFALGFAYPAFCADVVMRHIPNAQIVGEGRLSVIFWDVYDATLYAREKKLNPDEPFALSIRYMRQIEGRDIAERSAQEIRLQGFDDEATLAAWNGQMKSIFPDVKDGTVLLAVFIPGKETLFYQADKPIGRIQDAQFTRWFSNIWLAEKTSEPALRRKLLGMS